jgi:hypothetical protein
LVGDVRGAEADPGIIARHSPDQCRIDFQPVPSRAASQLPSVSSTEAARGFFFAKDPESIVFLFERLGVQKRPSKQKKETN